MTLYLILVIDRVDLLSSACIACIVGDPLPSACIVGDPLPNIGDLLPSAMPVLLFTVYLMHVLLVIL